jgi:hypothetical protein
VIIGMLAHLSNHSTKSHPSNSLAKALEPSLLFFCCPFNVSSVFVHDLQSGNWAESIALENNFYKNKNSAKSVCAILVWPRLTSRHRYSAVPSMRALSSSTISQGTGLRRLHWNIIFCKKKKFCLICLRHISLAKAHEPSLVFFCCPFNASSVFVHDQSGSWAERAALEHKF